MVPTVELPEVTLSTDQVTAVFALPLTDATNCSCWPTPTVAVAGVTVTDTVAGFGVGVGVGFVALRLPPPAQPARQSDIAAKNTSARIGFSPAGELLSEDVSCCCQVGKIVRVK